MSCSNSKLIFEDKLTGLAPESIDSDNLVCPEGQTLYNLLMAVFEMAWAGPGVDLQGSGMLPGIENLPSR